MRKVFGYLFALFAVVSFPSIVDVYPSTAAIIGRAMAWAVMSVIPAYFLLRNSGKKKDGQAVEGMERKKSPVKKVLKILLSAIGVFLLCGMIFSQIVKTVFMPFIEHDKQRAEFAQSIERADRECPIPVALGKGAITGIKLEDGYVTYYGTYDSDFTHILNKIDDEQKKKCILMSMLCINAQNGNQGDVLMNSLEKYGYGIRFVITQSGAGKFDFRASTEEIKALREKFRLNPHEALLNGLSISIEAVRASLPLKIDEGMQVTDYSLEDENIVIGVECDEDIYSIDEISSKSKWFKDSMFEDGLSDPSSKALLDLCKVSHTGIKYIFTGKRSRKSTDILLSSDEIRQKVQTPSPIQ